MEKLDRDFTKIDLDITKASPLWIINSVILMRVANKVDELVQWINEHEGGGDPAPK